MEEKIYSYKIDVKSKVALINLEVHSIVKSNK